MPEPIPPLAIYILQLLERQNLSMREGSMMAGLAPETISKIVRRSKVSKPRPDTLRALADALGGDYQRMLVLAGYLAPPKRSALQPEAQSKMRLIVERLAELPPESQTKILDALALFIQVEDALKAADATETKVLPNAANGQ